MANKVSKTKEYAIRWLLHTKASVSDISKELSVAEETVLKFAMENSETPTETSTSAESRLNKLMISETAGKRNKGVAIMTKEASFLSDQVAQQHRQGSRHNTSIFKPRG